MGCGSNLRSSHQTPVVGVASPRMDTGLVCRVECLFSSQLVPVPIYTRAVPNTGLELFGRIRIVMPTICPNTNTNSSNTQVIQTVSSCICNMHLTHVNCNHTHLSINIIISLVNYTYTCVFVTTWTG